jgi:hypothetical protein
MTSEHSADLRFQRELNQNPCRKAFAARLDMTLKRKKLSSTRVALSLGVRESDVSLWRAGVTVPEGKQCRRLSRLLQVDIAWLCTGSG